MKKLLIYLKDYKKESILAPLFKLLEAAFELMVPLVMAGIIDRGIEAADKGYILKMGLVLAALALVGLVSAITAQFFAARAAVGFSTKLRDGLFAHIQSLSFSDIDKVGTAALLTRMTSDINQVQSGVNMVLRLFLRSPIIVFGAMIMAFTIDVKCALVFVCAIPLLAIVVFGIMAWSLPMYKKVQSKLDSVLRLTRENLTGVRVIRAFHREEREEERFTEENSALSGLQMLVGRISAITNPATYVIVNAAVILLIYMGAVRVNIGTLSQGQVVAILNYMSQILVELIKLANLIVTITKALACADRVAAVFEIGAEESDGQKKTEAAAAVSGQSTAAIAEPTAGQGAKAPENGQNLPSDTAFIRFNHVSLTYKNASEETLTDIDFSVRKGETVGVIGGTGSGKTSLVNLIPGFYPATKGEIMLDGRNLSDYSDEELRGRMGIVPQKAVLFQGTIRSNLLWGKSDATEEEMWEALSPAQAKEIVEGKEGKLDEKVAKEGSNFSGGQRQRLTIARALIRKPEILILDDSASALDYATDAALRASLRTLCDDTTVFIVSQRASSIRHADKILVLDDGELAGIGTHDELLKSCEVYKEIYYSQYPDEKNK